MIQRKYWHISDVPLVVSEWTPETAMKPSDLTAMPLWIDLKGVPNDLFSHRGLKCISKTVGKFVKIHPNTEKCIRLDVARVLAEVNLHNQLVERVEFKGKKGEQCVIEVKYPWLPPRCSICQGWGHKGSECRNAKVTIFKRGEESASTEGFEEIPTTTKKIGNNGGNVLQEFLKELAAMPTGYLLQGRDLNWGRSLNEI